MFEVEWTASVPTDDCGDADLDAADTRQKYFRTLESARKYARKVYPDDWFGAVRITECHEELYEPGLPGKYLEYDGDSEFYEGPE